MDVGSGKSEDQTSGGPKHEDYEPPKLTVVGTLAELSKGVVPTSTDGIGPGSIL